MPDEFKYLRVKNWKEFQHYKDRHPPWIKLHLPLLDDVEYLALPDKAKLVLVHCWIAAGKLWNPIKEVEPLLPFDLSLLRLLLHLSQRLHVDDLIASGFLIPVSSDYNNLREDVASNTLAEPEQDASPEVELEEEKEKTNGLYSKSFLEFWEAYPVKKGKGQAFRAWKKLGSKKPSLEEILIAVNHQREWPEFQEYTPHASTWLNGHRWEDEKKEKVTGGKHHYRD